MFDKRKLELVEGDLTEEKTDAIVLPRVNTISPRGLIDLVRSKGGQSIFDQRDVTAIREKKTEIVPGQTIVTGSGNLATHNIIHVGYYDASLNPVIDKNMVKTAVAKALEKANELGLKSISIPVLQVVEEHHQNLPFNVAAEATIEAIREHLMGKTTLKHVRFVNYLPSQYNAAVTAVEQYRPTK